MKNKQYYIDLTDRWFDALLSPGEERELKAFLAKTEDPDFDEIKAVMGYFVTGKALAGRPSSRPGRRLAWTAVAVAASVALVIAIGLRPRQNECYILAHGEKTTDPRRALESMNSTLSDLFSTGEDVEAQLSDLFNAMP